MDKHQKMEYVAIRLPHGLVQQIDSLAEKELSNRSQVIRTTIARILRD